MRCQLRVASVTLTQASSVMSSDIPGSASATWWLLPSKASARGTSATADRLAEIRAGWDVWVAVGEPLLARLATAPAAVTGIQVFNSVALALSGALAFQVPIWALICTAVRATFHTRKSRIWP